MKAETKSLLAGDLDRVEAAVESVHAFKDFECPHCTETISKESYIGEHPEMRLVFVEDLERVERELRQFRERYEAAIERGDQ